MDEAENSDEVISGRNIIMIYLLNSASKKMPIKERDIIYDTETKSTFKKSFEMAKEVLKEAFGICVMNVPNSKGCKRYILCNEFVAGSNALYDGKQKQELTLLFLILSYIFMSTTPSSESVAEDELESFLKAIGIDLNGHHDYFGSNVKKLVTETFVKQLYLMRVKSSDELCTETKFHYSWGYRASIEFDKQKILEASCKVMKKSIHTFPAKYQEVFGSEEM